MGNFLQLLVIHLVVTTTSDDNVNIFTLRCTEHTNYKLTKSNTKFKRSKGFIEEKRKQHAINVN